MVVECLFKDRFGGVWRRVPRNQVKSPPKPTLPSWIKPPVQSALVDDFSARKGHCCGVPGYIFGQLESTRCPLSRLWHGRLSHTEMKRKNCISETSSGTHRCWFQLPERLDVPSCAGVKRCEWLKRGTAGGPQIFGTIGASTGVDCNLRASIIQRIWCKAWGRQTPAPSNQEC